MTRKEYELVYDALKNYHVYMDKDQRLLAEQILDDLYYPREVKDREDTDKTGQEFREELDNLVADAEEALANESEIKSLNFRQPLKCNPIEHSNKMENYLNLFEHIPEDEHNHISNKIWEALDRAGIKLSQDAELSVRIYDDEYEGDFDGQEYDE